MPNEIKPVIVADDGINRSIKPVIIADDGINKVKKKEVSQSTQDGGLASSDMQEVARKQRSESLSQDDGIYINPWNNENYKKSAKKWYKDITGAGDYKEIKSGDLKSRYDYLNKNATKVADLNGNPIEISYDVADQKKVKEAYNLTPEKIQKEEQRRQVELAKKAPEEQPFSPAIADGKLFNIANKEGEKEFEKAHFEYVKSGKYQKDVEAVQKENDLNDILNSVTTDLVGSNEDDVISKLQGKLKKYDYLQIEPSGNLYDGIKIKNNITGESKFINLDNWTTDRDNEEAKLLKGFLEVNIVNDQYVKKQKQVNDLRDKIEVEKKNNPYNVVFLQKELDELLPELDKEREKKLDYMSKDKYRSAASFDKYEVSRINDNITKTILKKEDIKKEASDLNKYESDINESFKKGLITEEDYNANYLPKINQRKEEIDNNVKLLKDDYRNISNEQSDIKNIAGNAFIVESERGNVLSGAAFSFVQGFEQAARILTEEEGSRGSDKGALTSQFAPQSLSEEYLSSGDLSTFETIVNGLANSGGSALAGAMTGGPEGTYLGLYASSYTNFRDQMNGPEFKDVSELEKILLAGSVGAVTSQLEKFGLTKMFSKSPVNKKIISYIFSKSLKGLPSNATAEMIDIAIEKSLKGLVANKVLKITGAGVIEYSTEAGQELTEIGAKELLNQVKGKKYFENPKTFGEVFERANKAGILGLLGGAGMQSITQATLTAKQQLDKYQLSNIENTINNKDIKDLFVLNIKDRILSGQITKDQGQAELNSLKESEGVLRQIPDNLTSDDRYTSFKLINERENLRKQMEGKDPALVSPISDRINEINDELKNISKNAVQVQTTGEVPVQPEARISEEVVQGEPQAEPQGVTEEGQAVQEVESLRAKEQDEIKAKLPNAEYKADGKIDVDKLSDKDKKIYDKIYANYDKLISLPTDEIGRPVGSQEYKAGVNQKKGRTITRTAPDGTKIKGSFKVVPASELIPSHNPNTFGKNEAFPQNKEGRTINDRDYETDKPAQSQVIDIAQNIDERAVTQTPIVSKEGIVYDGNNRTMSRQLAAQNKTDDEYIQALINQADMYGITEEDINAIENPTLVFEVEENLPFDTKTMAMFNKQEKKAQGPLQRAVAISKRISDRAKRQLANLYEAVEIPSDVTSDPKNMKQAIDILIQEGLVQTVEIPRFIDKGVATPDGVSFLEGVVMAASLNEDSIRELSVPGMGDIKKVILKNIVGLMQNAAKGEDSLAKEIAGAIQIIQKAKAAKISVDDYLSQYDMFKENQYTIGEMSMALLLDTKKPLVFKNFLTNYNESVGVENIFGEDTSKEAILNNTISTLINDYEKIKENLESIAKERGEQVVESVEETQSIKEVKVYHGGDVSELTNINKENPLFVSEDESQAEEYTKQNEGTVSSFEINENGITNEENVFDLINKLGLKSKEEGWDISDLNLFELLDPRFETSLSDEDINKVYSELEKEGFGAIRFTDTNLKTNKQDIQNIVIFNSKLVDKATISDEQFSISDVLKEKTNLQKVKSFLDKLEDDLDKFGKETLGVNLPVAAMKLIIKALKVSVQAGMTLEQAIKDYAQKNNVNEKRINDSLYSMSDFQARKTRERITGEKQPKVKISKEATEAKDISKRKVTKVIIKDEYKAMITQIKLEVKAAREAKLDLNAKRKMLASAISNMVRTGKIKASQAAVLVKRVSSINLDNPVMVERFTNYAQRVFERADYQQTLDNAFSIRKSIRKLLKSDNQAEVVGMAKAFTKIDPSLVDDIDAYIEMADKVKNAVKPSRTKGEEVVLKQAANIAEISEYSKNEIARQEQIKIDELLAVYDYLENISEGMSFKELQSIVDLLKEDPEAQVDKEVKVKEFLKNRFDFMAGIIETMFNTGIDPMTGEEITFDEKQKDLMKRVLNIDLNEMSTREAIKIVESVDNFLNNQITSGLEAAASSYEGAMNDKQLVEKGFKAKSLRLLFSNYIGKIYSEQLFSLPMLMERMFGGVTNSIDIMNKMGLVKLINGVNRANRQHNDIIDQYSKQSFYDSKGFMDAENVYERGMLAFLKRNLVGSQTEMKAEFERRVKMVQESINKLTEDGDPKEQKMGELYQKIYDKLDVAEMDMDIINANASKNNLDAINWWINQWSKNYSDLSDISLSVYNTQLGSDLNYTPDKYKKLSSENQSLDEGAVERNGAFAISIDYTDKNKTGVLMETTRPNVMPDGRYISLDFDNNNSKALKSALTDINTASSIRQIDGFINSKSFKKLIPESEDRSILTKRINTYIRRSKGKNIVPSDTIQYLKKFVNFATALGVGKALGGISQAVSQTIPVMVNTVVNAGRFDFAGADFNAWLNETGLAISNRGLESQSTVESIDRKLDTKGTGTQEALKKVTDLNQWYLKQFLVRPDVFIARSSFKSYYLQNLNRRGISTDIDWTTHDIDMEAANYAQAMIDRQQNISDPMLAGEFLASDDPIKQIARKVVLPFASFILNQKSRMYNDLNTLFSKTSSSEDRIIAGRSLSGLAAELVTFQLIGFGIRRLYDSIAASLLGDEDDEEAKKKKLINATKYPIKNIVNDIISPIPMTDGLVTWGLNQSLAQYPWMDDKEIKDAVNSRNKALELKGEDPMDDKAKAEFIAKIKEEAVYQVFEDDFDRSYGMIGIVGSTYQELGEMGKLATTGEFTDEYQGRETTKLLLESDRKKVAYAVPFMIAYSTGLLPKDIGSISRNYVNRIKKKAITEKQYERFEGVKKDLGRNLESWEIQLVKDKKESETAIDEIKFIERNGGLTERQGREYLKLMKAIGEPTVSDLTKIKNGQTADQILK